MLWSTNQQLGEGRQADIGIINAGGLRADLDPNGDGVITYSEAYAVLPFGNTNAVVDLTGWQVVEMLEQQWQPACESRPVLWLGLSSNVTYKYQTYETSYSCEGAETALPYATVYDVRIDGEPLDMDAIYTVAGNSFLLAGGDNFTVLAEGVNYEDTGYVDFDSFASYLAAHPDLTAASQRLSTGLTEMTLDGNELSVVVTGLAFTTDEAKPIAVDLWIGGVDLGVTEGVTADYYQYQGAVSGAVMSNRPSAGYVTVSKTLSDAELAQLQNYVVVDEDTNAVTLLQGVSIDVQALFTETEVQAALDARQDQTSEPENTGGSGSNGGVGADSTTNADGAGSSNEASGNSNADEEDLARTGANALVAIVLALLLTGSGLALALRKHSKYVQEASTVCECIHSERF